MTNFAILTLAALLSAQDPNVAQSLSVGVTVQSGITDQSPTVPALIKPVPYECFRLSTETGRSYSVSVTAAFTPLLSVGSEACLGRDLKYGSAMLMRKNLTSTFTATSTETYLTIMDAISEWGRGAFSLTAVEGGVAGQTGGVSTTRPGRRAPAASSVPAAVTVPTGTASTVAEVIEGRGTGDTFADCPSCPSLVVVPAGSFMMGSPPTEEGRDPNEGPRHVVTIQQAFAVGRYEVTFEEYDACVTARACDRKDDNGWGRGRRPVVNVTYRDAQRYVAWLSQTTGQRYFLPSEAEWEYFARAGTDTPWNTGTAVITDDANILNQFAKTVVVGGYAPNAFGIYDTIGNAAEWTQDCIDTGYIGSPADGSAAASGQCDTQAVARGGHLESRPQSARSAKRGVFGRTQVGAGVGFRVTRAL